MLDALTPTVDIYSCMSTISRYRSHFFFVPDIGTLVYEYFPYKQPLAHAPPPTPSARPPSPAVQSRRRLSSLSRSSRTPTNRHQSRGNHVRSRRSRRRRMRQPAVVQPHQWGLSVQLRRHGAAARLMPVRREECWVPTRPVVVSIAGVVRPQRQTEMGMHCMETLCASRTSRLVEG